MRRPATPPDKIQPWLLGRIRLPWPPLGYLYAKDGRPWGRLLSPHTHSRAAGRWDPVKRSWE